MTELLRGERRFLEYDWGFASYSFPTWAPDAIFIHDIYILPEHRSVGRGRELFEEIADIGRAAGKQTIMGQIELHTALATSSLKAQLAVGLVPISAEGGKVILRRSL